MCGIAGIITPSKIDKNPLAVAEALRRMVEQLRHRGPDDQGSVQLSSAAIDVALGHTRLSIIDLSPAGHQPMHNPQTNTWVTFNGEIYNYRELRDEISRKPVEWHSQSDTEIILKAYEQWGIGCVEKLRGMFAFCLWDSEREQLLLARDPFGIKPLYYYRTDDIFVFASEIRTILATDLVPRKLSAEGVASYLSFGSVESPLTIINEVRSLRAGHYLRIKREEDQWIAEEVCYTKPLFEKAANQEVPPYREAVDILKKMLEQSVKLHLVSDVPLAAFLSGGIDSSAIVGLMTRVAQEKPKTFSVVFGEKEYDESSYARFVAEHFGTDHTEIFLTETDLLKMLPASLAAMDQPTMDGINTYVIAKAVKEAGITVALSGLGADELFAGYPSFRRMQRMQNLTLIPAALRKLAARTGTALLSASVQQRKAWQLLAEAGDSRGTYLISRQLFSHQEVAKLTNRDDLFQAATLLELAFGGLASHDDVNDISYYELTGYMANTLLRDTDQMSMAHSLEVRVPFIDSAVVPYVLALPGKWKLNGGRPKPLLLDALGDLLPGRIWQRPKMGFTLPFDRWMHAALKSDLSATFSSTAGLKRLGLTEYGRQIWHTFENDAKKERWSRPWALYILKKWCDLNGVKQ